MDRPQLPPQRIFWHGELPPPQAQLAGEGTLTAASVRVRDTLAERDSLWERCLADLKREACRRLEQERLRLKADFVHVLDERISTRRNPATGEAWLQGTYAYVLLSNARIGALRDSLDAHAGAGGERLS